MEIYSCKINMYTSMCVLMIILDFVESSAIKSSCKSCDQVLDRCPILPARCEKARRTCGCCDECAGKYGDICSAKTVRCSSGLLCVNDKGEALETVPWFMDRFLGTCQNVLVFPEVAENTDVDERRQVP